MSQSSTIILDGTGEEVLAAINAALATVRSHTSGSSAPSDPVAYMFWADTSTGKMKQRNAANTAWIERWDLGEGGLSATVTQEVFSLPGSFTWTKPTKGTIARVQLWGGGGAGSGGSAYGNGGGGGGYNEKWILLSALSGTVPVIVASGGASSGANGGNSQFGTSPIHLIAYGGLGGSNGSGVPGDGGGPSQDKILLAGSYEGQRTISADPKLAACGGNWFGGGGAEGAGLGSLPTGGNSIYGGGGGGGGGAGGSFGYGGKSVHGGAGGNGGAAQYAAGQPGSAPGGGGGGSFSGAGGAGAAGRAIITVF